MHTGRKADHMTRVLMIAMASLCCAIATHAATPPAPEGWVVYPTPKRDACEWSRANMSKREWRVRVEEGRLRIESTSVPLPARTDTPNFEIPLPIQEQREPPCTACIAQVDDGWLVGFNVGEWGGRLWWTDRNGRNAYPVEYAGRCTDIADTGPLQWHEKPGDKGGHVTNIVSLDRRNDKVFAFEGLAHLGPSAGSLMRVQRDDRGWQACMVRNIGGAPEAVVADGDDAWLATIAGGLGPERDGALVRVDVGGRLQILAQPAFAALGAGLYANSMVKLSDGTIYVGMRHFVARLLPHLGGYREELLIPNDRPLFDFEPSIDDPDYPYGGTVPNCPQRSRQTRR